MPNGGAHPMAICTAPSNTQRETGKMKAWKRRNGEEAEANHGLCPGSRKGSSRTPWKGLKARETEGFCDREPAPEEGLGFRV